MILHGETELNKSKFERLREARRLVATGIVAVVLAACSSDTTDTSSQETKIPSTASTQATSTTVAREIPTTTTISPEVANATEQYVFVEKMKQYKLQLAERIIDALNTNQGNSANYFFEFDNNQEKALPDGYGAINVFIDVPAEDSTVGKYGMSAMIVRNTDGSFDLSTLEDVLVFKYIIRNGSDGLPSDRLQVESVSINGDAWLEHADGPDTNNLNNLLYARDVTSGDGSIDRLNAAYISANRIIDEAIARKPVSA